MTILERYQAIRPKIRNGAVLLVRGNSTLSRTIQWADDAYFNHSALIFEAGGRLMVLDANAPGVQPEFLETRISQYVDFMVLNPVGYDIGTLNRAVDLAIRKDIQKNYKYDFMLLPKVLGQRKMGIKVNHNLDSNRTICSVFTGYHYGLLLGEYNWVSLALKNNFITPEDHLRVLSDRWEKLI